MLFDGYRTEGFTADGTVFRCEQAGVVTELFGMARLFRCCSMLASIDGSLVPGALWIIDRNFLAVIAAGSEAAMPTPQREVSAPG